MKPDDIAALTEVVRTADRNFEKSGGSSRHWVREQFLPELERAGFKLVRVAQTSAGTDEAGRQHTYVAGDFLSTR